MQQAMIKTGAEAFFPTLDDIDVTRKRVVVRLDLNVPMMDGRVTDSSRVERLLPTLKELIRKNAKVIVLAHLGRPEGKYIPDLSLASLVDTLALALPGVKVGFGVDCVGPEAEKAVAALLPGEVLLLENLRFHAGEEKNDPAFARALAAHGDMYINDAFSCSHRSHASVVGIAKCLPFAAGRLMEEELSNLVNIFANPARPLTAIVGGAKISTKLELIENLIGLVDSLIIGGAMANTFLVAQGYKIGTSLHEPKLLKAAARILAKAAERGCWVHLPIDAVVASGLAREAIADVMRISAIPPESMILDIGPETMRRFADCVYGSKTLLWNGPLGAFETSPYDASTVMLARVVASQTSAGRLKSVAGGGDTVAALTHARLAERFSYLSTAGGAFLEWMEGKTLPGVAALQKAA
jgi:phosphoglycerate kinase